MVLRGITNIGYYYGWNKKLTGLGNAEAYLLRGQKYF
jgi:hypothetical protein